MIKNTMLGCVMFVLATSNALAATDKTQSTPTPAANWQAQTGNINGIPAPAFINEQNRQREIIRQQNEAYNNVINDASIAVDNYNRQISRNPKDCELYNDRGIVKYLSLRDLRGALADFNQAISINPKCASAYISRAHIRTYLYSESQEALADYNQAISIAPRYAKAYYFRAQLKEFNLGNRTGAIQDYRQAARLYREYGNTQNLEDAIRSLRGLGASE
jgi:tetratricopeptide (TPR) repeat protein